MFIFFIYSFSPFHKSTGPRLPPLGSKKAAEKAAESQKRKGSTSLQTPRTVKRQAGSSQQKLPSKEEVPDIAFQVSNNIFNPLTVTQAA